MEDYYEYLDSNGVTTLYKLIKDDTVALIDSYSVTINGITTTLDTHINDSDIHTPISDIENMVDTKIAGLVNSAPETLDTLKELSDALGNDPNFATTVANQIGNKANKDSVYTKEETNTLLEGKANSVHNHVVSDITDFPTIPTKTSELINDSGFLTSSSGVITSVSWSDITDKPNFSTVATSGSYTDLSNTPTIPTKVSQLENDMGFGTGGDTSDCVHKTGNETIDGTKTFNDTVIQKKDGIFKNDNIDIATTPSSNLFAHLFFADKNNVANAFMRYAQRTNGINELNLFVRDKDLNNYGVTVNTNNEFLPVLNNTYSLGSSGLKWANVYSTNDITNKVITYSVTNHNNTSTMTICSGVAWDKGSTIFLYGNDHPNYPGAFDITAKNTTNESKLIGFPNGTLIWNGKNVALDENLVHRSGDETINGNKTFNNNVTICGDVYDKNVQADLTQIPTSNMYTQYRFVDKNNKTMGYIQHVQRNTGVNQLTFIVRGSNNVDHGFLVNTNKELLPAGNNTYSLGASGAKWANVYATTFNGNLRGNADTATKATSADSVAWANVTGKPNIPTTPNAYVTATWASGLNWYRKWSNGFIEQGGFTSGANAPANKVVASILPLAFSNTKYTLLVQVTCGPSSGTSWGSTLPTTRSKSTTRFEVYLDTPVINGGGYDWYACGY